MWYFSDPDISICFNAATKDPSEKTCCSKSSELSYVTAAENFLRDTIRIKNAYLKKLVMDHIVQYEGKVWSIEPVQYTCSNTSSSTRGAHGVWKHAYRMSCNPIWYTYVKTTKCYTDKLPNKDITMFLGLMKLFTKHVWFFLWGLGKLQEGF